MHRSQPRRYRALRSCLLLLWIAAVLVGCLAAPAAAQTGRADDGHRVVLTGRVDVAPGERVDSVVIFDGPAVIAGDVKGAVVAFNGNVRVRGHVDDGVVAFNGRAIIEDGAVVDGDVVSSDAPRVAPGARVDGDVRRVNFANSFRALGWLLWLAWWVAVSLSVLALGLLLLALAPRVAPAAVAAAHTKVGPAIGWGLAIGVGLPIVSILVMFTLVGIPLGLIGLLSLALLYGLGYVVAALVLGRRLVGEPRSFYLAFFVGWLILRGVDLIPVIGDLITFVATIYGLGALTVAAWRAARSPAALREPSAAPVTPTAGPSRLDPTPHAQ
jgi:hypothetical protein